MAYEDEKIIAMLNQAKTNKKLNIQNEVNICGVLYTFASKELFEGAFSIAMPESFVEMPSETAAEKYPSVDRPQLIFSNEDGTINLTFSYTEYAIQPDEVENSIKGFKLVIKRMFPANTFYDLKCEPLNEAKLGYFDYRSYALDDDLYNIIFATGIDGRLLIGTFSCLFTHKKYWQPLAQQMMQSILDLRKDSKAHE